MISQMLLPCCGVAVLLVACKPPASAPQPDPGETIRHTKAGPVAVVAPRQPLGKLFITSLSSVIGWTIIESKGFECRMFPYAGTGDYTNRFEAALEQLTVVGEGKGANAFVNVRLSSESHEIQGSKWHSSIVHICGDYVVLK